MIVMEGTIATM